VRAGRRAGGRREPLRLTLTGDAVGIARSPRRTGALRPGAARTCLAQRVAPTAFGRAFAVRPDGRVLLAREAPLIDLMLAPAGGR
jgi:hypothetical protein